MCVTWTWTPKMLVSHCAPCCAVACEAGCAKCAVVQPLLKLCALVCVCGSLATHSVLANTDFDSVDIRIIDFGSSREAANHRLVGDETIRVKQRHCCPSALQALQRRVSACCVCVCAACCHGLWRLTVSLTCVPTLGWLHTAKV